MPLPEPRENESDGQFIDRCLVNSTMLSEFPDDKQRAAVCYSQLEKAEGKSVNESVFVNWECKGFDEAQGIVEGYGAVFGNIDRGRDIIEPGAFTETIKQHMMDNTMPAMFYQHNPDEPIGEWTEMREDSKGLFLKGRLWIDGPMAIDKAKQAFRMLKGTGMRGLSIGFNIMRDGSEMVQDKGVRLLKKLNLFEISPVSIPMNPLALPTTVKGLGSKRNPREIEELLITAGLSRREAQSLLSKGMSGLSDSDQRTESDSGLTDDDLAKLRDLHNEIKKELHRD